MKSQMKQQVLSRCLAKVAEGGIGKAGRKDRDFNQGEMQCLFAKLKELVPNMPRNKRLSKLEIIQNVIDYILDLEIALETHPATRSAHPAGSSASPARQPLGVLPPSASSIHILEDPWTTTLASGSPLSDAQGTRHWTPTLQKKAEDAHHERQRGKDTVVAAPLVAGARLRAERGWL